MAFHILQPFTGTGAIFLPEGLPPTGTCQYATTVCLDECYAQTDNEFDEQLRVSQETKQKVLAVLLYWRTSYIIRRITEELKELRTNILHWFGTGDCRDDLTQKVSGLIRAMPDSVVQMGFTRNRAIWQLHPDVFALTIEDKKEATDSRAMYAIPDYDGLTSVMYCPSYQVQGGYCGPYLCRDQDRTRRDLDHYINCQTCCRRRLGCFDRRTV